MSSQRSSVPSRRAIVAAAALALPLSATATGAAVAHDRGAPRDAPTPARGVLVAAKPMAMLSAATVRARLRAAGIDAGAVRSGIRAYRLTYRTVDRAGRATRASGLIVLPSSAPATPRTAIYEHGTQSTRIDTPSIDPTSDGFLSAITLGAAGLSTVAPDYLGLGTGPGLHPYLDVRSEVAASVDALRAARTFAARIGTPLPTSVDVTGFSQGGAAAVGVARELQSHPRDGFMLGALAPISGVYDLRGVELPAAARGRLTPTEAPFYIAYLMTAWQRMHHIAPSLHDLFRAPYDGIVTRLFDGHHDLEPIARRLPRTLDQLLTPRGFAQLRHPRGAFDRAVSVSEVCRGWRPGVAVHLYAARSDTTVPFANARSCRASLRHAGATVTLTDVGPVDHLTSVARALPRVASLFTADAAATR